MSQSQRRRRVFFSMVVRYYLSKEGLGMNPFPNFLFFINWGGMESGEWGMGMESGECSMGSGVWGVEYGDEASHY